MEGNLPSNKNQELNIRQSFLHLNNSNSKARVKIFFWKYLTALSTSNYKKCNIYLLNKTTYFLYEQKLCFKMFVDFTVPTKNEDITVITFRFSDIVEESCHIGMALSSGTTSLRTADHFYSFHLTINMQDLFVFSVHTYIIASTSHIDNDKFTEACHKCINRNECYM